MNMFSSHWLLGDTDLSQFTQYGWFDGVLVFLIGMCVVIAMLAVLIIVVKLYCAVVNLIGKKEEKKPEVKPKEEVAPIVEPAPVVSNDEEIVAVISAAIAAVYASQNESGEVPPFRVKSIIRK